MLQVVVAVAVVAVAVAASIVVDVVDVDVVVVVVVVVVLFWLNHPNDIDHFNIENCWFWGISILSFSETANS